MTMRSTGERFQHALGLAKQQLPHAFAIGGGLPYSSETRPLTPTEALPVDLAIRDDLLPRENEDLRDLEERTRNSDSTPSPSIFHSTNPRLKVSGGSSIGMAESVSSQRKSTET